MGGSGRAAHLVTDATSPTLLLAVLYPVAGALAAGPAGVAWSLVGMVFTVVVPTLIVHRGVRTGRYTDHHLLRHEQRAVPMTLAAASVALGVVALAGLGAPRAVVALQVAVLVTVAAATAVTVTWKISVHVAVVAAAAAVLTLLGGPPWALTAVLVPLVAWSRWALRAHTAAQIVAGAALGAGVSTGVLLVAGV